MLLCFYFVVLSPTSDRKAREKLCFFFFFFGEVEEEAEEREGKKLVRNIEEKKTSRPLSLSLSLISLSFSFSLPICPSALEILATAPVSK